MNKRIHKSWMSLIETISSKRVLNTHARDQQEAVDPWKEILTRGLNGGVNSRLDGSA